MDLTPNHFQGVGPFSEPVLIRVDPDFLHFNPEKRKTTSTAATATTTKKSGDWSNGMTPMTNPEVLSPPELAPRFTLILQELWFVIVASLVMVVLIVAVVAVVCLRRKRKALHLMMGGKNMAGHYNGEEE